jgi:phage pi2 protein 07
VIIFLIFIALVMPIVAILMDKKDYADLKNEKYDVSEDFMKKFALNNNQPIE